VTYYVLKLPAILKKDEDRINNEAPEERWCMRKRKPKNNPLKVSFEYEPTTDGEKRLTEIFEFLLSEEKSIRRHAKEGRQVSRVSK